ncbi:hypothetical protein [Acidovorax sp.]|uniref:hypothetical protein n=1 Tax=Acidovorax sp. TaxID=1872122 RepID=UPI0025C3976E|nr:hypothetical protein [Acidovorax sp.]MBW8462523.1 hypothetical protein [Acidovorax sp.]
MRSCYAIRVPAWLPASGGCWIAVPSLATGNLRPYKGVMNQQSQAFDEQTSAKKRVLQHCSQISKEVGA